MADYRVVSRKLQMSIDAEAAFVTCFAAAPGAFWIDSSQCDSEPAAGRWSFMGAADGPLSRRVIYDSARGDLEVIDAAGTKRHTGDLFEYLDATLQRMHCAAPELPFDFNCGFVGWFGYELKDHCGAARGHPSPTPDAAFVFADRLLAFDHSLGDSYLVCLTGGTRQCVAAADAWFASMSVQLASVSACPLAVLEPQPVELRLRTPYRRYLADIGRCLDAITAGESYEICLTHRIDIETELSPLDPLEVYRHLRRNNPAPYAAFLDIEGTRVLCSSPERYLRVTRDHCVESKPIKGTAPRGQTPESDRELRDTLEQSEKDRSEHLMIVDLLRSDLGRVCEVGSIHVPVLMGIETYESVHQMVSTVRGTLRPDATAIDCVRASFPGGSMTGAPKLRTMSIIDQLEPVARGVYSGSIGYLGLNGTADLNIVIRSIVVTEALCSVGVGGAIVALSDPELEFEETLVKARAPITAVLASAGATLEPGDYRAIGAALRAEGRFTFDPCRTSS